MLVCLVVVMLVYLVVTYIITHYHITPVPRLGAGALMLNAWDWTVTIK